MKTLLVLTTAVLATLATACFAKDGRADAVAAGKQVFDRNCLACHGSGPGYPPFPELPGTGALRAKYNGAVPAVLTERTDLTPEVVAYFVRNGASVMAAYRKTEISDRELAQLGAYLSRNNGSKQK